MMIIEVIIEVEEDEEIIFQDCLSEQIFILFSANRKQELEPIFYPFHHYLKRQVDGDNG